MSDLGMSAVNPYAMGQTQDPFSAYAASVGTPGVQNSPANSSTGSTGIGGTGSSTGAAGAGGASGASSNSAAVNQNNPFASLTNSNEFLQLLVAQLKYQNPLNPVSGTQFLSQTAQMSETAMVQNMVQNQSQMMNAINTSTASSLIGKTVTATDASGSPISGTVSNVKVDATSGPSLDVNGTYVPLSAVTEVS